MPEYDCPYREEIERQKKENGESIDILDAEMRIYRWVWILFLVLLACGFCFVCFLNKG